MHTLHWLFRQLFRRATIGYLWLVCAFLKYRRNQLARHVMRLRDERAVLLREADWFRRAPAYYGSLPSVALQIEGRKVGELPFDEIAAWLSDEENQGKWQVTVIPNKLVNIHLKRD